MDSCLWQGVAVRHQITQSSHNPQIFSCDINRAWRNREFNGATIPGQAAGFRIWGSGFGVQGLGFGVQGVVGKDPIFLHNNPARSYEGRVVVWQGGEGVAWM